MVQGISVYKIRPKGYGSPFAAGRIIHNLEIPLSIPYQKVALARSMARMVVGSAVELWSYGEWWRFTMIYHDLPLNIVFFRGYV